jgi:putative endonuclease
MDRRRLGVAGEAAVARHYVDAGYVLLDRNWRCRDGELDLVLAIGDTVVFCEVKTRSSATFGAPFEAVTFTKQRRLRTLALLWLADHPTHRAARLRFDVASVRTSSAAEAPAIEVIEHAF